MEVEDFQRFKKKRKEPKRFKKILEDTSSSNARKGRKHL